MKSVDARAGVVEARRPWDARLAKWLVTPLVGTRVRPNHLTTLRLVVGLAAAVAFTAGSYAWSNTAAVLLVLSNFLDHTDGELARLTGTSSRFGHWYDLASDAFITIALFIAMGVGIASRPGLTLFVPAPLLGMVAGAAVALIFFLRMRIEEIAGKDGSRQASLAGFETEDVLYLLPLVSVTDGMLPFLLAAALCAPLFAIWVVIDYRRIVRRPPATVMPRSPSEATR